jgi:hypothetical protein
MAAHSYVDKPLGYFVPGFFLIHCGLSFELALVVSEEDGLWAESIQDRLIVATAAPWMRTAF